MTYVNPLGGGNGSERCLIGGTGGAVGTCGGPGTGYYNAPSLIQVLSNDLGSPLVRLNDSQGSIWQNSGGEVLVRALSGSTADTDVLGYDAGGGYHFPIDGTPNGTIMVTNPGSCSGPHAGE